MLGLAGRAIESELKRETSADATVDRFSQRSLSASIAARFEVLQSLREQLLSYASIDEPVIVVHQARPSQLTSLHQLTHCIGHAGHGPNFQQMLQALLSLYVKA